ncbi:MULTISPECIES: dihydropteroate synthase [Alphaproteobacteria]|uniref:Dihydropteroate synthase n=2 Tax=Alphaproteobacteria TaxID=28211 RepID=A0A512HCQ3_9HYPH|nr:MULTISPECIES: dihydropteroate synthase [Alphaproteobacteria]GEO83150.1 dihydropteroate synthase [Ciceribacter naphthalenivorans]GLR20455.1 dihydropteroate synthase [Ciceribacter naphthalenivorans]GLT03311.1 dihydropteroate synthase [Sphingomonas psychrolutea]
MTTETSGYWRAAHGRGIALAEKGRLMAIVNVTPDSFSDGGQHFSVDKAVEHALSCLAEGADILDIGGESTRPGALPISAGEEQDRVLPVIERLARETDALMSIDTYRAETARAAIAAGAHIVNDVYGLQREPEIAEIAAKTDAGLCVMHTGRERDRLADVVADQFDYLGRSLAIATEAHVAREAIMLDPGFGFAKETVGENMALMARFDELLALGYPLLVGTSRKRFLGTLTGKAASERDAATAATTVLLRMKGASVFRVHNVAINRDALAIADAMMAAEREAGKGQPR